MWLRLRDDVRAIAKVPRGHMASRKRFGEGSDGRMWIGYATNMSRHHPVTLTFDNGPEPGVTENVLDTLAVRGIAATFFVIGRKLATRQGMALATRAHAEGHRIGNHTFFHQTPLGEASPAAAAQEIGATQDLLGDLAPEKLFRPFGGEGRLGPHLLSPAACDLLVAGQYTCVVWNAVPRDWKEPDRWPETALAQIAAHRAEGRPTVLALHDLPSGAMRHLPAFLDRLKGERVRFVPDFPDDVVLIRKGRVMPDCAGYVQAAAESATVPG
jgi:peptidoglycan-N-acetylglucosamine deacetylase